MTFFLLLFLIYEPQFGRRWGWGKKIHVLFLQPMHTPSFTTVISTVLVHPQSSLFDSMFSCFHGAKCSQKPFTVYYKREKSVGGRPT